MDHQKKEKWLRRYLKKNGYLRTLDIFERDLKPKKSKLSFQIVFPPKKTKNTLSKSHEKQNKSKPKKQRESKKAEIPKDFRVSGSEIAFFGNYRGGVLKKIN